PSYGWSNPWAMTAELCRRFACDSITPLGVAVEPDVYWRNANCSGPTPGSRHASAASGGNSSVANQRRPPRYGALAERRSMSALILELVSTRAGRELAAVASRRGAGRLAGGG